MKRLTITGLAALLLIVVGCQSQTKQYSLRGQVLAKDQAVGQLTVKHDDIPGFMPAMTMPYKVKDPAAMQDVQPGDTIAADLIPSMERRTIGFSLSGLSTRAAGKPPSQP